MKAKAGFVLSIAIGMIALAACGAPAEPTSIPTNTQPPAAADTQPPPSEGYMGGSVSNGGSLTGRITYSGPPVAPESVTVDKDQAVCGETIDVLRVQTDASGGLASAVVRITDIKSGKSLDSLGSEFVLDQVDCLYVPNVLIVPVGFELKVLNSDGILHNIHTTPFDNAPLNVAQPATQPELSSAPFTIPENIPVGCDIHKWMNATIVVVDNPYAVVTGTDGSFTLRDIPAGTYSVEIWHPEL